MSKQHRKKNQRGRQAPRSGRRQAAERITVIPDLDSAGLPLEESPRPRAAAVSTVERPDAKEQAGRRAAARRSQTPKADAVTLFLRRLQRRSRRLRRRIEDLRQEDQNRNFPESDAVPVQVLL